VTRGQLPQRAGSLGLTAVGLQPRYPRRFNGALNHLTCMSSIMQLLHTPQPDDERWKNIADGF